MAKGKGKTRNTYKFKTPPYTHQREAVKRLLDQDFGGALFMEPRTGKSKTTIDTLSCWSQKGEIDRAVIVCPNRVIGTWVREFAIHCPKNFHIQVWDGEARTQRGIPVGPVKVSGLYDLEIVIVNYEAFGTIGNKTASGRGKARGRFKNRQLIAKWLEGGRTAAGVLDESHKIGSPTGRASNMIVSMSPMFGKRLLLTGTPLTKAKKPEVIWMQWQFLNPQRFADFPTVKDFKNNYARFVEAPAGPPNPRTGRVRTFPKYIGPKNVEHLRKKMAKDAIIVKRDDCFDLPKAEHLVRYIDLKASRPAYDDMARDMIAMLEDGSVAEAQIKLVVNLRLSQMTSGFVTNDEGEISRLGFEKVDEMRKIMEEEFERDQKLVVAARWKPDLDILESLGRDVGFKTYSIRGKVKRADSDRYINLFRENTAPSLMIVQPQAASMGIDLSTAAHLVWFSNSPRWVDYTQTCDRIALNRNSVTFTHLIARNSYDEVILNTLREDGEVSDRIMSNPKILLEGQALQMDKFGKLIDKPKKRKRK